MGNLCGKPSRSDNDPFAHPGHVVGSAPPPSTNPRAAVPRTIGGGGDGGADASRAAGRAAEERLARSNQQAQKGKLARDLARDKAQSMNGALGSASREERRRREIDEGAETRTWN